MIENLNLKGDFLESQAFAYIGARSFYNLPISLPSTTGVKKPISGGTIYK
jgi:Predicted molecular chaperone distantly related to HSP70-fold metalloproteases